MQFGQIDVADPFAIVVEVAAERPGVGVGRQGNLDLVASHQPFDRGAQHCSLNFVDPRTDEVKVVDGVPAPTRTNRLLGGVEKIVE